MFEMMIWGGAAMSVIGLVGVLWCILKVTKAKRAGLSDEDLRAAVASVLPINLGAFLLSAIGLMLVVVGVILG
ncbi:hypothetical protein ACXYMO_11520 [Arenibacterium sp. CAU 1754]